MKNTTTYSEKLTHTTSGFLDPIEVRKEDGGQALIFEMSEDMESESGIYIKIVSWDEEKNHTEFNSFIGRKIKITIETID